MNKFEMQAIAKTKCVWLCNFIYFIINFIIDSFTLYNT